MSKNNFTEEDLIRIIGLYNVERHSIREIASIYGCGKSTIGDFLSRKTYREFWEDYDEKPHANAITSKPEDRRERLEGKRFFFTTAQSNTFISEKFWKSLENFLEHRDAQLVVGKSYYDQSKFKNKNRNSTEGIWFDKRLKPYFKEHACVVTDGLLWLGELNLIPTRVNVFTRFQNYTGRDSAIFPHCKVQMESMPAHEEDPNKFLYSTGSVTHPNFIQQAAGQVAEHHHIIGGLYVEIDDDGNWFARQVQAESETGCFFDLDEYFTPDGVINYTGQAVEAINWGDLHVEMIDAEVARSSFGVIVEQDPVTGVNTGEISKSPVPYSMLDVLKPKYQFCHDTSDFTPRNHHNRKDPHFLFEMYNKGADSVEEALQQCSRVVAEMTRPWCETVIVDSNHDRAFERWLKEADYRSDPVNAIFFLETQADYYRAIQRHDTDFNIFEHVLRSFDDKLIQNNVTFLPDRTSFRLFGDDGIECCWHGDRGSGGSRGSAKGFTKNGIRSNIGHSHSTRIIDGVYQSGTCSKIPLPYAKGAINWSHSHIITYRNGKRAIVTLKNGKWRA